MKRILLVLGFLALTATSAWAAEAPGRGGEERRDLFRFDFSCEFENNIRCTADARIFKFIRDTPEASPQWNPNLLAIKCDYQLIYADGAILRRERREDGVNWEIFSANGVFEIDLKDNPFNPNGATVQANLEFDRRSIPGTCHVRATDVRQ